MGRIAICSEAVGWKRVLMGFLKSSITCPTLQGFTGRSWPPPHPPRLPVALTGPAALCAPRQPCHPSVLSSLSP